MSIFPGSMIETTLTLCATDMEIELTQPFITPQVINCLWTIIEYGYPTGSELNPKVQEDFRKSADYLGIDILSVIGDPMWPVLIQRYKRNLGLEDFKRYGEALLDYGIDHNYGTLISYLIENGTNPSTTQLITATRKGLSDVVRRLLRSTTLVIDPAIIEAVVHSQPEVLKILISKPDRLQDRGILRIALNCGARYGCLPCVEHLLVNLDANSIPDTDIQFAILHGYFGTVVLIFPRVSEEKKQMIFHQACINGISTLVERLVSDQSINPDLEVEATIRNRQTHIVSCLLQDERITRDTLKKSILVAYEISHVDILRILVNHI